MFHTKPKLIAGSRPHWLPSTRNAEAPSLGQNYLCELGGPEVTFATGSHFFFTKRHSSAWGFGHILIDPDGVNVDDVSHDASSADREDHASYSKPMLSDMVTEHGCRLYDFRRYWLACWLSSSMA